MRKSKIDGWVCGLGQRKVEYKLGNVKYIMESRFEPVDSETTIKDRFCKTITSDFIPLTGISEPCKMEAEYVCSAAGKEN